MNWPAAKDSRRVAGGHSVVWIGGVKAWAQPDLSGIREDESLTAPVEFNQRRGGPRPHGYKIPVDSDAIVNALHCGTRKMRCKWRDTRACHPLK